MIEPVNRVPVLLFVDVVESVRLQQEHGDQAIAAWRAVCSRVRTHLLPELSGQFVERRGDGLVCQFSDVRAAMRAGFQIHDWAEQQSMLPARALMLRASIHAADIHFDEGEFWGEGLSIAARMASIAQPGETVLGAAARDEITADIDADIHDLGECYLKHVAAPVRLFRARPARPTNSWAPVAPDHTTGKPVVVVLSFDFSADDASCATMARVLPDDLSSSLARSTHVKVISPLSARALHGASESPLELARMVSADYVVTGRIDAIAGSSVRVAVEACSVRDSSVVFSTRVRLEAWAGWLANDTPADQLASELCSAIADAELELVRQHALPQIRDYSLFLGAVGLMFRTQQSDFTRSREALEELVARHPRRPQPRAWLAKWHVFRVTQGWFSDKADETRRALDHIARALDMQPDEPTALLVRGLIRTNLERDRVAGVADYDRSLAANPNNPLAWLYRGTALAFEGDATQALQDTEYAMSLSPFDPWKHYFMSLAATAALAAGAWSRAAELASQSLKLNALHQSTLRALSIAHAMSGDREAARGVIARIRSIDPSWTVSTFLARSPAGNTERGRRWGEALAECGLPAQ